MDPMNDPAYDQRLADYKARVTALAEEYPVGYMMVALAVGSLPPLPPPEITQAEIDADIDMLRNVVQAAQKAMTDL